MAISQPGATDKLNNPSHSLSHRVIANDPLAPAQTVTVDAVGTTRIGGAVNHAEIDVNGELDFIGTASIHIPHLQQSDLTDQDIANITLAQVLTFSENQIADTITVTSTSRFTIVKTGTYLLTFSGVAQGVINKALDVWMRINGTDVANSNTSYTFKTTGAQAIIAFSFMSEFTAGQYFEFWTSGTDTSCSWQATAAGVSPTRPATPSLIMTCNYISK